MPLVNIPSYYDDPNYRYKMPAVQVQTISRGNGIKTNLLNLGEISKALRRAPEYAARFCGYELGANSRYAASHGSAIINGSHTMQVVQHTIDRFIECFVLCPKCKLPEVDLYVENKVVMGKCNACGSVGAMSNHHKLATFLVKNPPEKMMSTVKGQVSPPSKLRSAKTVCTDFDEAFEDGGTASNTTPPTILEDLVESSQARDLRRQRKLKARKELLEKQEQSYLTHERLLQELLAHFAGQTLTTDDVLAFIDEVDEEGTLTPVEKMHLAMCALFQGESLTPEMLEAKSDSMIQLCKMMPDQRSILKAFEHLAQCEHKELIDYYALVCHWLYDKDLVEEEEFLMRYEDTVNDGTLKKTENREKMARRSAAIAASLFVQWLREAESESESESDD